MNPQHCFSLRALLTIVASVVAWPSSAAAQPPAPAPASAGASSNVEPAPRRRMKPLQVTIGVPPTAQDVGSEADLLGGGAVKIRSRWR